MHLEYNKKQYNKLRHQYKELKREYNNLKSIQEKLIPRFIESVNKIVKEKNLPDPFAEAEEKSRRRDEEIPSLSEVGTASRQSKSLYRQIMLKTHPDKKNNKKQLYIDATTAKKENNLHELIEIGKELNLKLKEITSEQLDILECNISHLKQKIQNIKDSYVFVWLHSNNKEEVIYNFLDRVKYKEN